jgi:hypothetical protein
MNKTQRSLMILGATLATSLAASALMLKLTPNSSWLAFAGWTVFFVSLQLPWLLIKPTTLSTCTSWLSLRKNNQNR